ncbi:hypothetical protein SAMN04515648_0992 [Phyllobacterium sp. CL33Tsu]|uniref:hypothetical protein n=1 Tax=Phyllobacterium sp. CL33Tsu TaxID=1798191 RepID=UPI0008E87AE6|nr:hypothetical protein [Phyllobacterium sp. CL33Tsu]SFI65245.1 hypothetical protein SAMN04515648_0992 [Phyllobacterium sp. CL33Tsu]
MPTKPPKGELQIGVELLKAALSPPAPESEWQQKAAKKMIRELHLKERSSLEWLVGVELPRVFKKFFVLKKGPSVGFSRGKAKEALGPYIRFAEQALRELGITNHGEPYSADTIAKALFDARKRRSRRTLGKAK